MGAPALEFTNVNATWNCSAECLLHFTYQSFCTGSLCQMPWAHVSWTWSFLNVGGQNCREHFSKSLKIISWFLVNVSLSHYDHIYLFHTHILVVISQFTHLELFSLLCIPSSLHNRWGILEVMEKKVCSLPHRFFFLYPTSSQSCALGHLNV